MYCGRDVERSGLSELLLNTSHCHEGEVKVGAQHLMCIAPVPDSVDLSHAMKVWTTPQVIVLSAHQVHAFRWFFRCTLADDQGQDSAKHSLLLRL